MGFGEPLPVDRLHNLQNLLDMYEYRPEDVCVNEAIANAAVLSGKIQLKMLR